MSSARGSGNPQIWRARRLAQTRLRSVMLVSQIDEGNWPTPVSHHRATTGPPRSRTRALRSVKPKPAHKTCGAAFPAWVCAIGRVLVQHGLLLEPSKVNLGKTRPEDISRPARKYRGAAWQPRRVGASSSGPLRSVDLLSCGTRRMPIRPYKSQASSFCRECAGKRLDGSL
jgi:hypothetical protein